MINTVIFDFGGVLIDWNPKYLYRKIFAGEEEVELFLQNICTADWNEEQDGGRTIKEATETLSALYPEHTQNIKAYYDRWEEMLGGVFEGTIEILKELKESKKYKLYGLTNWSAETFPIARRRYEFLSLFDGILVSGDEKSRKPFPQFYRLLLSRYNIRPEEAVFIDDNTRNIIAAEKEGIRSIHFTGAEELRLRLRHEGLEV